MGKTLIVAEKPSVGRDIAEALPQAFSKEKSENGDFLESADYVITWAVGHLVELAEPEDYDEAWKKWRRADLPIVPKQFKLRPRSGDSNKQLELIHTLASRDDVADVVNACDAGREGELIFAYTMDLAPKKKPVQRLWISSMTKKAIREGFEQLKPGTEMENLEASARSRSEADWLVGMNATRAATIRARSAFGGVVSLGRVQTPTLGILATREREIMAFEPETYYLVTGNFDTVIDAGRTYQGLWFDPTYKAPKEEEPAEGEATPKKKPSVQRGNWLKTPELAEEVVAKVKGNQGIVDQLEIKKSTERAPLLYDLTSLQRDANRRFGYTARTTLSAAQALYEQHKALTYPRTNSRYLTTDMQEDLRNRVQMLAGHPVYQTSAEGVLAMETWPLERIINDDKVDDHHAIIPTEQLANIDKLRDTEKRIYDLVVRRFLAAFYPVARYELTTVITKVEEQHFRTKGRVLVDPGWKAVWGLGADAPPEDGEEEAADDDKVRLPKLEQGEAVSCIDAVSEEKQTKPPARYSEGTLLSAMETAGKLVDDEALREAMKERGLGTPATRAQIIELLINRQYIQREGRSLRVTSKGLKLIEILEGHPLVSPDMTGNWEKQLRDIEQGDLGHDSFLKNIVDFTHDTVSKIMEIDPDKLKMQRAILGPCPRCAAAGREEMIRENARAFGCTSWKSREEAGCGFVIWRTVAGRQIMPDEAKELLENRVTSQELQGFRSRAGKPFRAKLKLNDEDKVEFVFPEGVGKRRPNKYGDDGGEAEGEGTENADAKGEAGDAEKPAPKKRAAAKKKAAPRKKAAAAKE